MTSRLAVVAILTLPALSAARVASAQPPSQAGIGDEFREEPFVVELLEHRVRFEDDGRGQLEDFTRVRIHSASALDAFGQLAFGYSQATDSLDVASVTVIRPDGNRVQTPASAVQDLSGAVARVAPVYTDYREKHVTVSGLRVGDVLEYRVVRRIHTAMAPGHFWLEHDFTDYGVVLDEVLAVDVPAARMVTLRTQRGPEPEVSETQGRRLYRWRTSHRATKPPALGPQRLRRLPAVALTTFPSWAEVGLWYHELQRDRLGATPEMVRVADAAVAGRAEPVERARAIYDYVARRVRYVSLSFGIGRYQPHPAGEVFTNEYGDCKGKHTLLAALLATQGLRAYPALVNTSREVDPDVPSPAQFDHLISITEVGDTIVWLDTTTEVAPFGLITANLRGQRALVIPPDGPARLVETPRDPPFGSSEIIEVVGALHPTGRLTARLTNTLRGDVEVLLRYAFRNTPKAQWLEMAKALAAEMALPRGIKGVDAGDPDATEVPFRFSLELSAGEYVAWEGSRGELRVPLPSMSVDVLSDRALERDSIDLGPPVEVTFRARLDLPAGIAARAPLPVRVSRDYAEYRSTYAVEGQTVVAERTLKATGGRLPRQRRADLDAFLRAIRADEGQQFQLEGLARVTADAGDSQEADELHERGYVALERGDLPSALRLLKRVVELDPSHQWGWNNLGRVYLATGELDSAVAAFAKQIEVNPYDEWAHNNLGRARWRQGRLLEAAEAFRKQIEVTPLDRHAHANLGKLYQAMGWFEEAATQLQVALSISPDDADLWIALADALLSAGRGDSALGVLEHAMQREPTAAVRNDAAYTLAQHKAHLARAAEWADAAIASTVETLSAVTTGRSKPDDYNAEFAATAALAAYWDTYGWVAFARGDNATAERYVHAAWLLSFDMEIGDHLAQIYERAGRVDEAARTYALAVAARMHTLATAGRSLVDRQANATRARLVALAGSEGRADRMVAQARVDIQSLHTVRLSGALRERLETMAVVIVGPGPQVEAVEFPGPPERAAAVAAAMRTAPLPVGFPDSRPVRLVRFGVLACIADTGDCDLSLMPGGRILSIAAERTEP
jgi:tetratricopeptide (TPR) repeat protein